MNTSTGSSMSEDIEALFGSNDDQLTSPDIITYKIGHDITFVSLAIDIYGAERIPAKDNIIIVPGSKYWLEGCCKIGDTLAPIINLAKLAGLKPRSFPKPEEMLLVISPLTKEPVALAVSEIMGLKGSNEISPSNVTMNLPSLFRKYTVLECSCDGKTVALMDIKALLSGIEVNDIHLS